MTEKNLHPDAAQPAQDLTHVRADGSAHIVDVTMKDVTTRTALAEGPVHTRADVIAKIFDADLPKGDALPVARVAGIMGANAPRILFRCATRCPWVKLPWILSVARILCALWRR